MFSWCDAVGLELAISKYILSAHLPFCKTGLSTFPSPDHLPHQLFSLTPLFLCHFGKLVTVPPSTAVTLLLMISLYFTIWGCILWAKELLAGLHLTEVFLSHKALQSLVIPAGPCPGLSVKSEAICSASHKLTGSVLTLRCISPAATGFPQGH